MTTKRGFLGLVAVFAVGVALSIFWKAPRATLGAERPFERCAELCRRIAIRWPNGSSITLSRNSGAPLWRASEVNRETPIDARADLSRTAHLIDLLSALSIEPGAPKVATNEATEYGISASSLRLEIDQEGSAPQIITLGHLNHLGNRILALLSSDRRLFSLPMTISSLLGAETSSPTTFQTRTITTFISDDVEEVRMAGSGCAPLRLQRDGDRWRWLRGARHSEAYTSHWVERLTRTQYDAAVTLIATTPLSAIEKRVLPKTCQIEFSGLRGRSETIELHFEPSRKLWVGQNRILPFEFQLKAFPELPSEVETRMEAAGTLSSPVE